MNYSIAKMNAKIFAEEKQKPVRISKAKRKNNYVLVFEGEEPYKNYEVIETVEPTK